MSKTHDTDASLKNNIAEVVDDRPSVAVDSTGRIIDKEAEALLIEFIASLRAGRIKRQ